jgi:hypothetical protein
MFDMNTFQLTAIGGTFALLWGRIQGFIDFLISLVIEKYDLGFDDKLYTKYFLAHNCVYKIEWHKSCTERMMYLKNLKSRRSCKFIEKRKGIYCLNWFKFYYIDDNIFYSFRWDNFFKKHSNQIYFDLYNINDKKDFNNFSIHNYTGAGGRTSVSKRGKDAVEEPISVEAREERFPIIIKLINEGVYDPLFFNVNDFGEDNIKGKQFEDYYLNDQLKRLLLNSERWLHHKDWFNERNITWKRGMCLYGKPGCGKSSFVVRLSKYLGLPLNIFNLSTLDNTDLIGTWNLMEKPCIALFEDFDSVFHGRTNVADAGQMQDKLTFDTVLNIIDGANSCDGVLTIVTTNCLDKLDDALLRSGRIDDIVEITEAGPEGKKFIAQKILNGHTELYSKILAETTSEESNADFENKCIKIALENFWKEEKKCP